MLMNLLICGSNFHSEEQDDEAVPMSAYSSPSSTPRRSRLFCKSNNNRDKNPYATRGLDKFSALLADLEEKRQKIYAQNGTDQDISFVRFVYKNSNDLVPVVVKLKDNNNNNNKIKKEKKTKSSTNTIVNNEEIKETQSSSDRSQDKFAIETSVAVREMAKRPNDDKARKKSFSWRTMKWDRLRRPGYYLPIVVIMILLLLTVFGRSVAILCTSIGWYVVPALKESAPAKKRPSATATKIIKKDYVKRLSEKRMVNEGLVSSPRVHNNKSPLRQHNHQKSW